MMANDAEGLLDGLSIAAARIVGISMGGRIALDMATRYPNRTADLVVVASRYRSGGKLHMSMPMKLASSLQWLPFARGKYPQSRDAFEAQRNASMAYEGEAGLPLIRARTLILHGRTDRSAPYEQAVAMSRMIPSASIKSFRGGHLFFLMGERQQFLEAVCAF